MEKKICFFQMLASGAPQSWRTTEADAALQRSNDSVKCKETHSRQPRVFLFDLAAGGKAEVIVAPHGFVGRVAFSPDGNSLARGGYGCVWLFDLSKAVK